MMSSVIMSALSKDSYNAMQSSIVIRIKTLKKIHRSIKIQFRIIAFINCLLKKNTRIDRIYTTQSQQKNIFNFFIKVCLFITKIISMICK